MGKQDIVFAGGGEELDWTLSCLFDAMGAMSSKYNDTPQTASRAYDATRDGFVIAGGGGVVVLEELDHALARGAKIYGEVTGYGATSDGHDMVAPSRRGRRAVHAAGLVDACPRAARIDYINAHGTSTPAGDVTEVKAIRRVFGNESDAADLLDQIADRAQPWCDRRPRGDLFAADDERRFHRGLGQCHDPRPGPDARKRS